MQPTLAITAPAPGLISVNGRFFGEISPDAPLFAPVAPCGAVYLEYRPLKLGWRSLARRLVMSGGAPLADSLPEDLFAVRWPRGVTEVELAPERVEKPSVETLALEGRVLSIHRGPDCFLETGTLRCPFPPDGETPTAASFAGGVALFGQAGPERYILTLSGDLSRRTGFLRADRIEPEPPDSFRATTLRHDVAGHATLERWRMDSAGLTLISSEPCWEDGAPRVPQTPEETALAAVEAALLGLTDEAEGYLTPSARAGLSLSALAEEYTLCLPMKYAPADGRGCVGLLRAESANLAAVHPLYYDAARTDGGWRITALLPAP